MSTRGAVGIGNKKKWRAVYNHWDSYPTGLGKEVWKRIKKVGLKNFSSELLKYRDWREYLNEGICEYCGKKVGQPHSIGSEIFMAKKKPGYYPDTEIKHHKHSKSGKGDQITTEDADPLFIEWIYIIEVKKRMFHVFMNKSDEFTKGAIREKPFIRKDGFTDYGHCAYKHTLFGSYDIDGDEPKWEEIDRGK